MNTIYVTNRLLMFVSYYVIYTTVLKTTLGYNARTKHYKKFETAFLESLNDI